jgi:hypothetical protein
LVGSEDEWTIEGGCGMIGWIGVCGAVKSMGLFRGRAAVEEVLEKDDVLREKLDGVVEDRSRAVSVEVGTSSSM